MVSAPALYRSVAVRQGQRLLAALIVENLESPLRLMSGDFFVVWPRAHLSFLLLKSVARKRGYN